MAVTEVRISIHPAGLNPKDIAEKIKERFPDQVIEVAEFSGQVSVIVKRDQIIPILKYLHDDPILSFDHLQDLTAVDYLKKKDVRFEVVYNLYSIRYRHHIRIRAQVTENDPKIRSAVPIWAGADWHERECFDMFGIVFTGHPDLRRILMPEDWEGYPLRKDYPLQGPALENDWPGFTEVLKRSKELKEFEWEG
ncbi:MAG: NADH-quinone oxidoreductase subunit C [Thermodesulfovibrionales bacterium]|nr:NADH-quinone oxidoreductase subunit C [Thermodesulfovibrionales bacterium]